MDESDTPNRYLAGAYNVRSSQLQLHPPLVPTEEQETMVVLQISGMKFPPGVQGMKLDQFEFCLPHGVALQLGKVLQDAAQIVEAENRDLK